jgi:hypothetical protein
MDTAWNVETQETDQDGTPRPWSGSHARPRASLRLMFADGARHGLSYSDYKQRSGKKLNILKVPTFEFGE